MSQMLTNASSVGDRHTRAAASVLPDIPKAIAVGLWILGLWVWGSALNRTSAAVDMGIMAASFVPATLLFWTHPEYGIIALMFFASGFLAPDFVDVRLLIGGGLEMRDIMLLWLFGLLFFRQLAHKSLPLPLPRVGALLALFFVFVVFSLFDALFFEHVPFHWALSDTRILSFYLIFFIAAWGITHEDALHTVIAGSFVITDITAVIVLMQQYIGPNSYFVLGMNDGSWVIWQVEGGMRVVPPGIVFLYFVNLISIGLAILGNTGLAGRLFLILHSLFLSIALLFTYTRSAWVASAIALAIMLSFLMIMYRDRLPLFALMSVTAGLLMIGTVGLATSGMTIHNGMVRGIADRFDSIFQSDTVIESDSLLWRRFELQEATSAIIKQPLVGVGLGNSYRPITAFQGESAGLWTSGDISAEAIDRFTRYVHISYIAIAVKMGIPALIVLVSFLTAAVFTSFTLFTRLPDSSARAIVLAVGAGLIGLLQWSLLHAHLMMASGTAVIGLVVGLLACVCTIYLNDESVSGSPS